MDPATIGVLGVLASALISAFVAHQTSSLQLRVNTDQQFSLLLFQNRLESYRSLYKHLSDFIKILNFGKLSEQGVLDTAISRDDVVQFLLGLEKWDSENAIYLTNYTSGICIKLRKELYQLISKSNEYFKSELGIGSLARETLYRNIAGLEAAIKNEIGVYAIKPFPTNTDFKPISTYEESRKYAIDAKERLKALPDSDQL
jgi:hypothetical protein